LTFSIDVAIGNAVAILTDVEKRKQYDLYGSDQDRLDNTRQSHSQYNYTRGFEGKINISLL
jgi:DnaJ family protein B protein 12